MATKHTDDCFHKAEDDEELFTLLARDPIAPVLVRIWVALSDPSRQPLARINEAARCATKMDDWRKEHRPHKTDQPLESLANHIADRVVEGIERDWYANGEGAYHVLPEELRQLVKACVEAETNQ